MRILHTADWHFGRSLEGRSRLPEQEAFVDELYEIVTRENIDLILIAGDVFDTVNPPAAAEQLFYDCLARLSDGGKRQVVIIAGNHDNPDRVAASRPLADRHGITLLGLPEPTVLSIPIPAVQEEARIFALPYPSESRLQALLAESSEEEVLRKAYDQKLAHIFEVQSRKFSPHTVNLAMSHIYVLGSYESDSERPIQVGGAYTVSATTLPAAAQYVALGHLHKPQNVPKAPTLARYSGSPLAYSFSEAGHAKSVTVLDVKPGEPARMEEIFLSSGKPLVRWEAKEGLQQVHGWIEEGRDLGAWIDLKVHVADSIPIEDIHKLRKAHEGLITIQPVYPAAQLESVTVSRSGLPIDEMFRSFYERQTGGAKPDDETVRMFLELIGEDELDAELES
ncbi:exonuclease SbcCD subunit D [Aneurinibacillus sp. Ricciae_BoGa-3]|uniref:exonuclease SbcCD subunit D n=1 Tax=Aneurinibacillus sp. Ricciae_BoGa-3 TaxID=3022697 RepID=UPI0023406C61|nr:exonuclease SbcCD subunit D [Aneurinibacillus sp. Ricciae_BoGa-3]WCK56219.1 exonuclease SbcCD subunit D [Aneurinibacillus sp. Ricciae_BoGa-3]